MHSAFELVCQDVGLEFWGDGVVRILVWGKHHGIVKAEKKNGSS